jgi:HEAT repeat protein
LEDEDAGVRTETARALQELRWRPKDPSHKASYSIARKDWDELVRLGRPAVASLIKVLKDEEPRVREKAARTLGEIGDVAAVESLTESLEDTESIVREAAQKALDKIKKAS